MILNGVASKNLFPTLNLIQITILFARSSVRIETYIKKKLFIDESVIIIAEKWLKTIVTRVTFYCSSFRRISC